MSNVRPHECRDARKVANYNHRPRSYVEANQFHAQMNSLPRASLLHVQFQALSAIIKREQAREWFRLINEIVVALQPPFTDEEQCAATIAEAKRRFESMLESKGGFSEFYVHRDNFEDQRAANKELEEIKTAILAA